MRIRKKSEADLSANSYLLSQGTKPAYGSFDQMGNMVTIIKALSDYVHSKRLKLGIYSDAEYMYIHNCHSLLWFIRDQRSLVI